MSKRIFFSSLLIALLFLAACGPSPEQEYQLGSAQLTESFDAADAWETFSAEGTDMRVTDGSYRLQTDDGGYVWGLNDQSHDDVVIEAEATQYSSFANNAYGVMCRADVTNNGDGYYFLVSGDGYYSIRKGEGDGVPALVDWATSSAVNEGEAANTIRAVCIGDYLAMYVNDTFVADIRDGSYASGYAGLAGTAFDGGDIDIAFDNLTVWSASLP
ncbi:MAG: hypothetical protein KC425_27435 [Anaerolineales bacterium]|nr:hypothetical protein [Anaerolineales bacterium]